MILKRRHLAGKQEDLEPSLGVGCKLLRCLNMREFTDVWEFENDGAGGRRPVTPCLDFRGRLRRGRTCKNGEKIRSKRVWESNANFHTLWIFSCVFCCDNVVSFIAAPFVPPILCYVSLFSQLYLYLLFLTVFVFALKTIFVFHNCQKPKTVINRIHQATRHIAHKKTTR